MVGMGNEQAELEFTRELKNQLRRRGIELSKINNVPMFGALLREVAAHSMTPDEFLDNCDKLLIFNPSIAYVPPQRAKIVSAQVVSEN